MGDWRNKLKREADDYRHWRRHNRERLRDRVRAGERFVCQCGAVSWQRGEKPAHLMHVARWKEPDAFYCPACKPADLEEHLREIQKMYGGEGFTERQDMKQLALFAEGKRR